jgi:ATP-binding cassette subfamily C protein CydD
VPQHPYLFAGTIAENIALGAPAATGAALAQAARLAGAEDFIAALPGGFSALLSERALELSAGQRQRLALARAFLRDAPLVLLDEPVEHLDPVTARDILDVLGTALAGRTVVMISHRLQLPAGQVLRLDHGRLDHGRLNPAQSGHARPDPAQPGQVKPGDGHLSRAQLAVPGATS